MTFLIEILIYKYVKQIVVDYSIHLSLAHTLADIYMKELYIYDIRCNSALRRIIYSFFYVYARVSIFTAPLPTTLYIYNSRDDYIYPAV